MTPAEQPDGLEKCQECGELCLRECMIPVSNDETELLCRDCWDADPTSDDDGVWQ